jgi:uncharacterized protein (TIGR03435 family)
MRPLIRITLLLAILTSSAELFAQAFEVASIRLSHAASGIRIAGNRFDCTMYLKDLIATAYEIKNYQIAGPDYLDSARFEVNAIIPAGSAASQVPTMLRTLLEDRFKLKAHFEKKDQPVYLLVVPKKEDLKLMGSDETVYADATPITPTSPLSQKRDGEFLIQINSLNGMVSRSRTEKRGSTVIMRLEILKASMTALADYLTDLMDRPVVNATDLKDSYRMMLDLPNDIYANALMSKPAPVGNSSGPFGTPAGTASASFSNEPVVNAALAKVGLKLESRKSPIDTLIVERIEKTPTEN